MDETPDVHICDGFTGMRTRFTQILLLYLYKKEVDERYSIKSDEKLKRGMYFPYE